MRLVSACREGVATDEQLLQLRKALESSLDARQAFVELMHLENTLSYQLSGPPQSGSLLPTEGVSPIDASSSLDPNTPLSTLRSLKQLESHSDARTWSLHRVAWAGLLASCLVLAGWLFGRHSQNDSKQVAVDSGGTAQGDDQQGSIPLAAEIVSYSPGSRWGLMNLAVMPGGTSLRPGQPVQLESGTAKIRFANGGIVVLQGPAVLEVQSGEAGFLRVGKATLLTSEGRGPVQLTTPSSRATVRNADLGVVVNETDGSADVCVLAGNVEVALLNDVGIELKRETIAEGFAGRFQASRRAMFRIELNEQTFIREVPEAYIAYHNLPGFPGDQVDFEGALGMDFVVKDPIEITKLGVFDSDADGLRRTITAELWSRNEAGTAYRFDDDFGGDLLVREVFTETNPGDLVASNRFKSLRTPLHLEPGAYTIVAYGYGEEEPNGNEGDRFRMLPKALEEASYRKSLASKTLDDGRGAILFVGSARFAFRPGVFPAIVDPGSVNRYRAGTFEFRRAKPESDKRATQDYSI